MNRSSSPTSPVPPTLHTHSAHSHHDLALIWGLLSPWEARPCLDSRPCLCLSHSLVLVPDLAAATSQVSARGDTQKQTQKAVRISEAEMEALSSPGSGLFSLTSSDPHTPFPGVCEWGFSAGSELVHSFHSIFLCPSPLGIQGESQCNWAILSKAIGVRAPTPTSYPTPHHPYPFRTLSPPGLAPDHLIHAGHPRGLDS